MATRVAPQQDRDLRSTSHKIDGLLVACMALTVLLFAIVVALHQSLHWFAIVRFVKCTICFMFHVFSFFPQVL